MNEQLDWFRQVLETAVQFYFRHACAYTSLTEIPQPADTRFWSGLLVGKDVAVEPRFDEKVVLMLSLVPYLCPWILDIFFTYNKNLDRPYTEFGGRSGGDYRGFLPTGETAAFILCGDRPVQRMRLAALFDKNHWFHTADVLALTGCNEGEPFLSGLLTPSASLLRNLHTLAFAYEPDGLSGVQESNHPESPPGVQEADGPGRAEGFFGSGLPEGSKRQPVPDAREGAYVPPCEEVPPCNDASDRAETPYRAATPYRTVTPYSADAASAPTGGFLQPPASGCTAEKPLVTLQAAKTQSPCLSCDTSPCCKILHIDELTMATVMELDKIRYYLNFPYVEVLLTVDGKCSVYYSTPCRHFDAEQSLCRIHDQAAQTEICRNYSPYHCFYRKAEADKKRIGQGYIWLNAARFRRLEAMCRFDDEHRLQSMPPPDRLVQEMNAIAYDLVPEPRPPVTARPDLGDAFPEGASYAGASPCTPCSALCCRYLVFPVRDFERAGSVDFYTYALGFPGVRLACNENRWYLTVETSCRHLTADRRCALYGDAAARPLPCRYLDPCKCLHPDLFRAPGTRWFDYEAFTAQKERFVYNAQRRLLDAGW